MFLRLRFFICAVFLSLPGYIHGREGVSAFGTISASATVAEPVGLLDIGQLTQSSSPALSSPLDAFEFLLVSPARGITLTVNGSPVEVNRLTTLSALVSGLSLKTSLFDASAERTVVLTLIYSEN